MRTFYFVLLALLIIFAGCGKSASLQVNENSGEIEESIGEEKSSFDNTPLVGAPPTKCPAKFGMKIPENHRLAEGKAFADKELQEEAKVNPNTMMDENLFKKVSSLAATWNRSKGREKDGAHAGVVLKIIGDKYYNVFALSLGHSSPGYRSLSSLVLALSGRKESQEKILEAFTSEKNKSVKSDYLLSLGLIVQADFPLDIIKDVIKDEDPTYASRAPYLLFFILGRDKEASFAKKLSGINGGEMLVEFMLKEKSNNLARCNAVIVFGRYPTRKAIDALVDLLSSEKTDKQFEALICRTLGHMTGLKLSSTELWQNWRKDNLRYIEWNNKAKIFQVDADAKQREKSVEPSSDEYK